MNIRTFCRRTRQRMNKNDKPIRVKFCVKFCVKIYDLVMAAATRVAAARTCSARKSKKNKIYNYFMMRIALLKVS